MAEAGRELLALRPATRADLDLVRRWIGEPDIVRWWGSANAAEAEIALAFETPSALCRMILSGGEPIGYGHAIDAGVWGPMLPQGMPAGTYDIDLFIASRAHRGRGAGVAALDLICAEVFSTTFAPAVSVFVPIVNERAVRAYEKAGFRWERVWNDPIFGACWMMLRQRPAA